MSALSIDDGGEYYFDLPRDPFHNVERCIQGFFAQAEGEVIINLPQNVFISRLAQKCLRTQVPRCTYPLGTIFRASLSYSESIEILRKRINIQSLINNAPPRSRVPTFSAQQQQQQAKFKTSSQPSSFFLFCNFSLKVRSRKPNHPSLSRIR